MIIKDWDKRYADYIKERDLDYDKISKITGLKLRSVQVMTKYGKSCPRWAKMAIIEHELNKLKNER